MQYITIGQIVVSMLVIVLVLLQERSSGAGGLFGSGESGGFYQRRRGIEQILFNATIAGAVLFAGFSVAHLVL